MPIADLLLHNGHFITMEDAKPRATALAIRGSHIIWIGDQKDSKSWIGKKTEVVDLKGAFAYPGFIDSHAHIYYQGESIHSLHLEGCKDKKGVLAKVKEHVEASKKGEWILGFGWDEDKWLQKSLPTASDIDAIAPDNPVVLRRTDTHSIWVNSYVLKVAGLHKGTPDIEGGKIFRDASGHPTGILVDNAMLLIHQHIPKPTISRTIERVKEALNCSLQLGLTMIHNAVTFHEDFEAFKFLDQAHALPLRIYCMMRPEEFDNNLITEGPKKFSSYLEARCLKFFMDGALGSRGAALLEPYKDDPQNCGSLLWKKEEFLPVLEQAKQYGYQVAVHAIGDKANRLVLDAYEEIGAKDLRWRIEHAQLLDPADVQRFSKLKVLACMQPLHAAMDMAFFEDRVGAKRTKNLGFVLRSLLDNDAIIAGGSDAPVVDINPLLGIYTAVTRQDSKGLPKGGWYPEQRVTPMEALKMYTINAAYSCFREKELGSLKEGKLADIVVLPENLLTCAPQALIQMPVLYTIVNGKIKFNYPL